MKISDFIDNKIVVPLITKAKKLKEKGTRFSDIVDKDGNQTKRPQNLIRAIQHIGTVWNRQKFLIIK